MPEPRAGRAFDTSIGDCQTTSQDSVSILTAIPGREAALDFTDGRELAVTIAGEPFAHLWFEWVLSFSGWTDTELAPSESFEALVSGLQGAAWTLGTVPQVVRHDNLSASSRFRDQIVCGRLHTCAVALGAL